MEWLGTVKTRSSPCQGEELASRDDKTQPFPLLQDELEIIRLAVMMYVRFPLLLRNVEDLFVRTWYPCSCRDWFEFV
jgi:hypothetical protein